MGAALPIGILGHGIRVWIPFPESLWKLKSTAPHSFLGCWLGKWQVDPRSKPPPVGQEGGGRRATCQLAVQGTHYPKERVPELH